MANNKSLGISFGVLSPRISVQLDEQKLLYEKEVIDLFESDREALNRCRIRELIPESQIDLAYEKLIKRIGANVTTP